MFITGIIVMMGVVLASHMGLTDEISKVVSKIIVCPKCCTFWIVLILLIFTTENLVASTIIALTSAYISYWFGLLVTMISSLYEELWQKVNKRKRKR